MNRKNTILIAVLINAGLLSVLLIAALTTQDESLPAPALMGDATARFAKEESPLFGDSMDLAMRKSSEAAVEVPVAIPLPEVVKPLENSSPLNAQLQIPAAASQTSAMKEEPIVHQLPSLAPELQPSSSKSATAAAANRAPVSGFIEVAVRKGESLEKIAKQHHTTVDEIIKLNQLPSSFLKMGQVLKVPSERPIAAAPGASLPKLNASAAGAKSSESSPEYYTVKVGDNPWTIAMKHHIKVEELLRLNGLNEEKARKLKPGDRLRTR